MVSRRQLRDLGRSPKWIRHRVRKGRLLPVARGVFAVGRPELTTHGRWMAAVLACGAGAALSHRSAGELWGIWRRSAGARLSAPAHLPAATGPPADPIEVSVPPDSDPRPPGIKVHRRRRLEGDITECAGIPVTSIVVTLVDLATAVVPAELERAVNEADKLNIVDPERLLASLRGRRDAGVGTLRKLLDRRTFRLTDSELERRLLRLIRSAGLPLPETGAMVNGFKVDFFWPDLGLVVETDGLRYHRTPAQQARDRVRDQAHMRAGLTCLRFTHAQVRYEPELVIATLAAVGRRLTGAS